MSVEKIAAVSAVEKVAETQTQQMAVPAPSEVNRMEYAMQHPAEEEVRRQRVGEIEDNSFATPAHHRELNFDNPNEKSHMVKEVEASDEAVFMKAPVPLVADAQQANLGERILDGIQNMKQHHAAEVGAINKAFETPELDMQQLLKLQLDLTRLTMQEDLLAKTASKSTQNLDSLLKTQ